MASATVDHHYNHLHLESIPVVDLRLLSQPELLSLSLCSSSPSPANAETELFTPKIDRSVFNESAGSRKQTFSRLRLAAPRNQLHHPQHSSASSKPFTSLPLRQNPEPLDEESSSILPLLKSLFKMDDSLISNTNEDEADDYKDLVPVQIDYQNANSVLQSIPVGIVGCSGGKRKRGRPRKDEKDNWLVESQNSVIEEHKKTAAFDSVSESVNVGDISSCSERKRGRGRPRKEESQNRVIRSEEKKVESEIEWVALGNVQAILGIEEELRKRTEAMRTEAELLEYMGGLEGEWASKSQKKRIIDATGFGNVLPQGWKLMLFVKKRAGHVWLACSRYISPNGQQFVSCKEVSSYLLSFGELKDSSQSTLSQTGHGIGSGVKPTSGNFPITCTSSEHEKQASVLRMGSPREVQRAETIKCHKCTMTFIQQDDFICHLLSSHQGTAKSSGHGTSTNEEVIIKNGKYECQFCYELFKERSGYSSHLGVHMKNNMKNVELEGSGEVLMMQNSIQPSNFPSNNEIRSGFPCSGANKNPLFGTYTDKHSYDCNFPHDEQDIQINRIEKTLADENCDEQNTFCVITNNTGEVTDTAAIELNVCLGFDKVLSASESNGVSQSSDRTDVQLALHSMEEKKREMVSNSSLLSPFAEGNMFSDKNLEDTRFASCVKGMETGCKGKVIGYESKASCANTCRGPDNVTIDIKRQNCYESCSLVLSSNEQRGNLVDDVKGASVTMNSAHAGGSGRCLTSSKDDNSCVISNDLILASTGTLDDPESVVASESWNNESTIGFQSNHCIKKPSQDSGSALFTLHGKERIFPSDDNAFKVASRTAKVSELDVVQKSSGLIQAGSHDSGLDVNIMSGVREACTKDCLFAPSLYNRKTFTGTVEERKQVKGSESHLHERSANQQKSSNESSMNEVSFVMMEVPKHKVENSLIGNAHARLGASALTGTGQESISPLFSENWEKFSGKNNVPGIGSGSVHEPQQNKGAFEDLFRLSRSEQSQAGSHGSGLDVNILAGVRQARTKDCLYVPSLYKKTFTSTVEERKLVKGSESHGHEQSANRQNSSNETSMNKVSFIMIEEPKHKLESSLIGNAHARVGAFAKTGSGQQSSYPHFSENWEKFAGKNNVPGIDSSSVHDPKQSKGAFEDIFCLSGSEQSQVANNLNTIHAGRSHVRSRFQDFENSRTNEIMIGFGNHSRPSEDSMTGLTWKSDEGSALSGLADTSSQLQSSGYYPTFDVMSHKAESEMFNISAKYGSVSGFEGLRSDSVEHMDYNILSLQQSSHSGESKVPSYDPERALRLDTSIWLGKEALPLFPKMAGRHHVTTVCSWCGNEFCNEAVDIGAQRNSMAVMCASCQARFHRNRDFL